MRKLILATLAMMMPLAAQASDLPVKKAPIAPFSSKASSSFDAFLSGANGNHEWDAPLCCNSSGDVVSGRGSFAVPIINQFGFQGDVALDSSTFRGVIMMPPTVSNFTTKSGAVHAFWRDPAVGLLGLIGQRSVYSITDGVLGNEYYPYMTVNHLGVEGQYFLNNATLYGQLGYVSGALTCCNLSGYDASAQIRYFPTDDIKLTLKGSHSDIYYSGFRTSLQTISARGEYHFPNTPLSVFGDASYSNVNYSGGCNGCLTETKALVGLSLVFADKTLLERDRSGASLDPFDRYINFE